MGRRKLDRTEGGADIEKINDLHNALVDAAFVALKNELDAGEVKPATLNTIRQICSDAGVQPTRQQQEAFEKLNLALSKVDLQSIGKTYSY
jgi:hypothetical protein